MRYFLAVAALLFTVNAHAAVEQRITLDFVGFSEDGEHFVVKKFDYNTGWTFSVRALVDGVQVKSFPFDPADEESVLKKVKRKYKIKDGVGPKSPDGEHVAMGAQEGRHMDILIMKKPKIGRFQAVQLKSDERRRPLTEGMLKKVVWSPDGNWLVAIIQETTTGDGPYSFDTAHAWKFKKWKVRWFREGDSE